MGVSVCVCVCVGGGGGTKGEHTCTCACCLVSPVRELEPGDEGAICHVPLTQPTCNATLTFSMSSATLSSSFSRSESVVLASTYWLFHFYRNSHMR